MKQNEALGRLTKITQLVSSNEGKRQSVCVCVCVCVCEREREREGERERERETHTHRKGGERGEKPLGERRVIKIIFLFLFQSYMAIT